MVSGDPLKFKDSTEIIAFNGQGPEHEEVAVKVLLELNTLQSMICVAELMDGNSAHARHIDVVLPRLLELKTVFNENAGEPDKKLRFDKSLQSCVMIGTDRHVLHPFMMTSDSETIKTRCDLFREAADTVPHLINKQALDDVLDKAEKGAVLTKQMDKLSEAQDKRHTEIIPTPI